MALPYRLAQRALGDLLQMQKLGLLSPRLLATTAVPVKKTAPIEAVDPMAKKGDWLDNWGKWHTPRLDF
ncbi:MAG: hypothetical protein GY696_38025 [Gammaproteobacteria bacterium]|nr:hypothetical protein [Gammaproteobacteria bacterium]